MMTNKELEQDKNRLIEILDSYIESQYKKIEIFKSYKELLQNTDNPISLKRLCEELDILLANA